MKRHIPSGTALLLILAAFGSASFATQDIDWNRARELHQRSRQGAKLTPDEQAYLNRAIQLRQRQGTEQRVAADFTPPPGLIPLTDMNASKTYKGQDGGLYGQGRNQPPADHLQAALRQAREIQPLDAAGHVAVDGKVVMISVGMSNTTQEFSTFVALANKTPQKSPQLVIVDGAQGGMDAKDWARPVTPTGTNSRDPWTVLQRRLERAHVAPAQVQVAWIKQARKGPGGIGEFPQHADEMQRHMVIILNRLKETFPNLRIAYLSSRIYAGYAKTPLNPEPYAYESAFVVRSLVQDQINGKTSLNCFPEKGEVKSPLLLWGPYLWADGERGRQIDDLVWKPEDLGGDGTHPSNSGRDKVAKLLLEFMTTEPTAKPWFCTDK